MSNRKRISSYLYEAASKNRAAVIALVVMEIVISLLNLGFVLAMRDSLDGAERQNMSVFRYGLICMVLSIILRIVFRALFRFLDETVRSSIENNLKGRLFHHLLYNNFAQTEAVHTGEWMNRLTSDTSIVANGLTEILPAFFGMTVKLVGAVAMIVVMIPDVSYFLLPAGIFSIFITWVLRKKMKLNHKAVQESDGVLRMFLQERLSSMMVVRAFCAEESAEAENLHRMEEHKKARMRRNLVSNICNIGFAGLMNGLYIIGFAYCGYGLITEQITYGTLLAVIQLIGQVQTPFAGLSGIIPRFYSMTASSERLMEVEQFEKEQYGVPLSDYDFTELVLENISFEYPDEERKEIFSNVSLGFRKGDCIAIMGHSGGGKSTLFKLLLCLYTPVDGQISVCLPKAGKVPLSASHRPLFAYVPQGNFLMSGTIREAVTFTDQGKTNMPKIRRALQIACADTFVAELEQGIDTVLGEHGAGLSEGQMQRLAIARALYTDAPILLFDEATSSLDAETEKQVLENLKAMTDKTILIVTHRPAALEVCNRIVEINGGRICER